MDPCEKDQQAEESGTNSDTNGSPETSATVLPPTIIPPSGSVTSTPTRSILLSDNVLRCLFILMGMGTLLTYNCFISCTDYFTAINSDVNNVSGQMVAYHLSAMFLTTIALLPFSTLDLDLEPKELEGSENSRENYDARGTMKSKDDTKTENTITLKQVPKCLLRSLDNVLSNPIHRVLYGFSFTFLFLLLFLLLYTLPSSSSPPSSLSPGIIPLNIFSTFVGIADATSSSGVYAVASSPFYTRTRQPIFASAATFGAALSGFIVSLLRLATRIIYNTDIEIDTDIISSTGTDVDVDVFAMESLKRGADLLIWLAFGFVIMLIGAVLLVMVDLGKRRDRNSAVIETALALAHDVERKENEGKALNIRRNEQDGYEKDGDCNAPGEASSISTSTGRSRINALMTVYLSTLKITWKPTLSAFLNFFMTLSLFPGVVVSIPSAAAAAETKDSLSFNAWMPIVLITMFNFSDCAGRFVLGFESWWPFQILITLQESKEYGHGQNDRQHLQGDLQEGHRHGHQKYLYYNKLVWYPTLGRIIFYPLLALCILPSHPRPLLHNDILSCILLLFFGASNGFIHCANFTLAPTMVNTREKKNATSILLLIAIYSGLCLGAYFGLVVEKMIRLIDS